MPTKRINTLLLSESKHPKTWEILMVACPFGNISETNFNLVVFVPNILSLSKEASDSGKLQLYPNTEPLPRMIFAGRRQLTVSRTFSGVT